jgi:anti-sigma factor RsiW
MNQGTEQQRFEKNRLGYLHGTLSNEEKAWMDLYLSAHAEAAAEIQFDHNLRTALGAAIPASSPAEGLPAFMARVRNDNADPRPVRRSGPWWRTFWPIPFESGMKPIWIAPITVIVLQTGIIAGLLASRASPTTTPDYSDWRGASETRPIQGPLLRITFKPAAKEADIRLLLVRNRGEIVGGPGQLGHYYVKVTTSAVEDVARSVAQDGSVDGVEVVPSLPKED